MFVKYFSSFFAIALACLPVAKVVAQGMSDEKVGQAIEQASQVLNKAVLNYPSHRSCFSCHHQALPLLAQSIGNVHHLDARTAFYEQANTQGIKDFTARAFSSKQASLSRGADIGGKALTVAYGLWAMDLAGASSNETTLAMVEYLLQTQSTDGAWDFQSLRPPAASSRAMTSAVAVYGLRSYAHGAVDEDRIRSAYNRVQGWSQQIDAPQCHEDLIGQLWLEHMLNRELNDTDSRREEMLQTQLWSSQREDGGWAQTQELSSDAYATGQALTLLAQVVEDKGSLYSKSSYRRGVDYLLNSQLSDGSWLVKTRSKPVQVFFDNGDPHGESQFISLMATSWATAALREFKYRTGLPLESPRVQNRLTKADR